MMLAEAAADLRRTTAFLLGKPHEQHAALVRDGFLVLPNFLPPDLFERVSAEAEHAMDAAAMAHPPPENHRQGFGPKQPFSGGFDRWDGSTLNRFLTVVGDPKMPALAQAARMAALSSLTRQILGLPHSPAKTHLYLTVNGEDLLNRDPQRDLHRDTFFSAMKFWLFLRPVTAAEGPFQYVPGSHRLTPERLAWEQAEAEKIIASGGQDPNAGGSFRIGPEMLSAMNLPPPVSCTCAANTLVIANTLGFHARGRAEPGSQRLTLYGWRRPFPFGLMGR